MSRPLDHNYLEVLSFVPDDYDTNIVSKITVDACNDPARSVLSEVPFYSYWNFTDAVLDGFFC